MRRIYGCMLLLCLLAVTGIAAVAHGAEPVEIIVEGIEGDARQNVLKVLVLPYGLVKDGVVDRLWLERFVRQADQKVLKALEPFGYYAARVAVRIETPAADRFLLRVNVESGLPVIVTDVHVSITGAGASESALQALAAAYPLRKGDVLLHQAYERTRREIQARAQEMGYLDADYTVHEIRVDPPARSARIALILETGEKYYVHTVVIEGAPDYPDAFLRRYVSFAPGDVFSYAKLAETQLQFNNSERFREVTVLADKIQAQDHKIPVRVLLKPLPRRTLRPGVGYGTNTGARFSLRYRDLNLFHRGHELFSNLFISESLQGLATSYIIPGKQDIRSFTSAQLNAQREDVGTYQSRFIALELAENRSFGSRNQGAAYVKLQQEEYTIGGKDSSSRYVLPGIRFSGNHYDGLIRPVRGFRYAFDLRGTHHFLGSDAELLQLMADVSHILPLPGRLSLKTGARGGVTIVSDSLTDLPPSLRFFAGGDQSVRGYAYQSLGPRDAEGRVVGGKHLLTGSVELQRALFEDWAVSVFYNAGNAFDSFKDVTLYQAAGVGVHYFTPIGALNLSVAQQIGVENPRIRIHLTVGFEF
jgi:translocation and assembly module TamA